MISPKKRHIVQRIWTTNTYNYPAHVLPSPSCNKAFLENFLRSTYFTSSIIINEKKKQIDKCFFTIRMKKKEENIILTLYFYEGKKRKSYINHNIYGQTEGWGYGLSQSYINSHSSQEELDKKKYKVFFSFFFKIFSFFSFFLWKTLFLLEWYCNVRSAVTGRKNS